MFHAPARRHRLHPRTRPCRAQRVGGADLLSGPACAGAASPGALVAGAHGLHWLGRFISHVARLLTGIEIHPGREDRPARLHRPRHGRGGRRDRRDRRRLHDLPGRHARRHVADQGRQAPSDARPRRHRRRQLAGAGRLHGRRRRARRLQRGGRSSRCRPAPRRSATRRASSRPRTTRGARQAAAKMGFSAYGVTQGDDPVSQAMKGLIDNASGARAPDRAALAGDREAVGEPASARARTACPRTRPILSDLRGRQSSPRAGRKSKAAVIASRSAADAGGPLTDFGVRIADFGRNALQTASSVSMYGPPIRSMQYGTAAKMPGTGGVARRAGLRASRRSTSAGRAG